MSFEIPLDEPIRIISREEVGEDEVFNEHFMQIPKVNLDHLPKPEFKVTDDYHLTPMPAIPAPYIQFRPQSNANLFDKIDYEMDEEDMAWLEIMNNNRQLIGLEPVSEDDFEKLIDRFEKESFLYMKSIGKFEVPPAVPDEDAVCRICLKEDSDDTNLIIFCDHCNLPLHQDCYGIPYVPEGQWLCRKCFQSPTEEVRCILCPNAGGVLKMTDTGCWVHVLCALWVPGVSFGNMHFMEPIVGIDSIPTARLKSRCHICMNKNVGATVRCRKRNCHVSFHATCAQLKGLHLKFTIDGANVKGEAFCSNHSQVIAPHPQIFTEPQSKYNFPVLPMDNIQDIGRLVSFQQKGKFVLRLIAYWTLKRMIRRCVPLLTRLQTPMIDNVTDETFNKLRAELLQNYYFKSSLKLIRKYCRSERARNSDPCDALNSFDDFLAKCLNHLDIIPGKFDFVVKELNRLMELAQSISDAKIRTKRIRIVDILIRRVHASESLFLPEEGPAETTEDQGTNSSLQEKKSLPSAGDEHHRSSLPNPPTTYPTHSMDIVAETPALRDPSKEFNRLASDSGKCPSEEAHQFPDNAPEAVPEACITRPHSVPSVHERKPGPRTRRIREIGSGMDGSYQPNVQRLRKNTSDDLENVNGDGETFNALDIVWAKCQGCPWFPAIIIDPAIPNTSINGLDIPEPPQGVIALGERSHWILVCYYDRERTWKWLPVSNMKHLGQADVDNAMLSFSHHKDEKSDEVRRAYSRACKDLYTLRS